MTAPIARCRFRRVTPQHELPDDPERAQVFESARLTARTAHEIASPPLVTALGYLSSLSNNTLLPVELRYRAKQAALRVAEAVIQLECLPDVFNAEDCAGQFANKRRTVQLAARHKRRRPLYMLMRK
jgi:hypothetical protein